MGLGPALGNTALFCCAMRHDGTSTATSLPYTGRHGENIMLSTREKAAGATSDPRSAHQGLPRVNLLFGPSQYAITSENVNEFRAHSLPEIGTELTRTYGERAQAEAKYFKEVNYG